MRCSDTPFRAENLVSRALKEGEVQMLCSDTPFLIEKHVSRTGIRDGGCGSCSDTPFREQKPVSRARRGRKRRTEATPHCTTRYDHPTKPQNHKTTTHHTTSYHTTSYHITSYHNHIQTRQHHQQTKPIPYTTPPHTTKSSSPKTGGRALLISLRTD